MLPLWLLGACMVRTVAARSPVIHSIAPRAGSMAGGTKVNSAPVRQHRERGASERVLLVVVAAAAAAAAAARCHGVGDRPSAWVDKGLCPGILSRCADGGGVLVLSLNQCW